MAEIQQNTLYLTTRGSYLSCDHLTLLAEVPVYPPDLPEAERSREKAVDWRELSIPIHHLESVCVFGASSVSPPALDLCWEHGVAVNFLSEFGHFQARLTGVADTSVTLRRVQFRAADDPAASAAIARQVVAGKIQNSRNSLLRAARENENPNEPERLQEVIDSLARQIRRLSELDTSRLELPMDEIRGAEGLASQHYFSVFTLALKQQRDTFTFTTRSRRPPRDRINCLLSFLYSLVRPWELWCIPPFSLFHSPAKGYRPPCAPAAASDVFDASVPTKTARWPQHPRGNSATPRPPVPARSETRTRLRPNECPRMRRLCALLLLATVLPLHAAATNDLDQRFPVRGLAIAAPSPSQVDRFVQFIRQELAPRHLNTLILRVDFNYQYASRPELAAPGGLSRADVTKLAAVCRELDIRVVPQINLLGHQSWSRQIGKLLQVYPEFDETPWVTMPEKYAWPNPDGLYCKSYCPLHPKVHEVVFAVVDELCDAFDTDAFHAGMDEVFYIGEAKCPRCSGKDKAELFAGEVKTIRDHLATKNRKLWLWGDRLLDGKTTGLGEWEASLNDTHRAVDLIPRDVVICDWHYERAEPTAAYFALKGLPVVTCPWKNPPAAAQQVRDIHQLREQSNPDLRGRALGIVQTVWSGANSFMDQYYGLRRGDAGRRDDQTEAGCFIRAFDEMADLGRPPVAAGQRRHLLFIGQAKGYQHEAISSAMATLHSLGHQTGLWDTSLRTDCTAITKQPLKWEAKNLDAYDAVVFYTDGDLDLDAAQKADLLSFVRDDGKGFIGIHSAAITLVSWPEFGEMLGGTFDGHPWGQFDAPLVVEDPDFPGMRHLPRAFSLWDEIYQIKGFSRETVRVLLSLDATKLDLAKAGVTRTDKDFAVVWARHYGKGRVLYNGLGHVPALWDRPDLRRMWTDMVQWAVGAIPGNATPRPKPAP